jgi:hypothetical protein
MLVTAATCDQSSKSSNCAAAPRLSTIEPALHSKLIRVGRVSQRLATAACSCAAMIGSSHCASTHVGDDVLRAHSSRMRCAVNVLFWMPMAHTATPMPLPVRSHSGTDNRHTQTLFLCLLVCDCRPSRQLCKCAAYGLPVQQGLRHSQWQSGKSGLQLPW